MEFDFEWGPFVTDGLGRLAELLTSYAAFAEWCVEHDHVESTDDN